MRRFGGTRGLRSDRKQTDSASRHLQCRRCESWRERRNPIRGSNQTIRSRHDIIKFIRSQGRDDRSDILHLHLCLHECALNHARRDRKKRRRHHSWNLIIHDDWNVIRGIEECERECI